MEKLSQLEARVAAATQNLAGRKDRVGELEKYAQRLEAEVHGLNNTCDQLREELAGTRAEQSSLQAKNQQVAGENKRLISENNRFRGEFERLEGDNAALREERGRLTRLLAALIEAVEKDAGAPPEDPRELPNQAEIVEMTRPVPANGGHKPRPGEPDYQEDIPNEAARRLMDRIRDRIEAQRA